MEAIVWGSQKGRNGFAKHRKSAGRRKAIQLAFLEKLGEWRPLNSSKGTKAGLEKKEERGDVTDLQICKYVTSQGLRNFL